MRDQIAFYLRCMPGRANSVSFGSAETRNCWLRNEIRFIYDARSVVFKIVPTYCITHCRKQRCGEERKRMKIPKKTRRKPAVFEACLLSAFFVDFWPRRKKIKAIDHSQSDQFEFVQQPWWQAAAGRREVVQVCCRWNVCLRNCALKSAAVGSQVSAFVSNFV